ncbi:MAG: alpha-amylase family glycosyl hydrolase, partial [Holophagales bacterium]|nr:alpha-amylase family glycosyl hydrolase [Holophagales bacterium]
MPHRDEHAFAPLRSLIAITLGALCAASTPARDPDRRATDGWQHDELRGDVYYQVFVRSFADSDGDGVGDFAGLTARLDYLNDGDPSTDDDLGVDGLWLMPMFESPSYHGYDVVDYLSVDEEYGTNAGFRHFLGEAHRRGMRVIVDFVMNHTGEGHPWFQASAASRDSPFRDWYVWRDDDPGWTQPWGDGPTWHESPVGDGTFFYGIFWSGMPDLNFAHPPVGEAMRRLALHWLAFGVDGFRLDATRHLFANGPGEMQNSQPETHAALREFAAAVRQASGSAVLVGENWTTTEKIAPFYGSTDEVAGGDQLPMNFNFPLADSIVTGLRDGTAFQVMEVLTATEELYPEGVLDAPFLRNHDQLRLATELATHPGKMRAAAAVLLTLPGVPFLYYGEEVGLENGGPGRSDPLKRTPMPWRDGPGGGFTAGQPWFPFAPGRETANVEAQTGDPASLLSHYRRWIRVRKASEALRLGALELVDSGGSDLLAFVRRAPRQKVLVVHNFTDQAESMEVPAELRLEGRPLAGDATRDGTP